MSAIDDSLKSEHPCEGSADRISDLRAELLLNILQLLPLRDAARTSILSRQWRSKWVSLPNIVLDKNFFQAFLKGRQESPNLMLDYMGVINDIIYSHVGSISKFALYIPLMFQADKVISQWIRFICANKSVKKFIMYDDRDLKTDLPASLFSCASLTHLELTQCKLPTLPSSFRGLPCLIRLKLCWLTPCDCKTSILGTLISQCPQLRTLCIIISELFSQSDLTIRAPKLQNLLMSGKFSKLHLEGTSAIKTCMFFIECTEWYHSCHLADSFSSLANVETLGLGSSVWKKMLHYEFIPPKLFSRKFEQLKSLHLMEVQLNCSNTVSFILCLLEACPSLERLSLQLNVVDYDEENDVDHRPQSDGFLQCLKSIEIISRTYRRYDELQFIKHLLAYSPVLEVMTVALTTTMGDPEGKPNLADELLQYGRASPKAKIILNTTASTFYESFSSEVHGILDTIA